MRGCAKTLAAASAGTEPVTKLQGLKAPLTRICHRAPLVQHSPSLMESHIYGNGLYESRPKNPRRSVYWHSLTSDKATRAKGDPNPEREPPRFPRTHSLRKKILAREFFPNLLVQSAGLLPHETSPFAVRRRATEPDHPE